MGNAENDIRAIFCEALERDSPERRAEYLEQACQGDCVLRARVEALLDAHLEAGNFLGGAGRAEIDVGQGPLPDGPGTVIGPYKLLEQIGEGGFGVVYMAEQTTPVRRQVALKIIKPGMDTKQVIARFEAERQALAMMEHPNIAKVLDAGETESRRPYFVMELVQGVPLTAFCDQQELATRERLKLFIEVCRAVQHAHQKGVIHRDLKPTNILVTMRDDRSVPKVIDFGVAKALSQRLTENTLFTAYGQMVGTPLYMSPEQAQMSELDVDTRSDVYSLGVLLYELLTGTTPFDAQSLKADFDEMRRMIREADPPRPSARVSTLRADLLSTVASRRSVDPRNLGRQLHGELDWVVMKALEKDRTRRYESANDFAADVQRYLDDDPVLACPPSALYRFRKFARRHKVALSTSALLLVAAIVGLAATTFLVRRERDVAEANYRRAEVLRQQAKVAEQHALVSARLAEQRRAESQRQLVRSTVAQGVQLMDKGDTAGALVWFVEALKLDEGDPVRELAHRIRVAMVLSQCPKPAQIWFHSGGVHHAEFSPDGRRVVTAGADSTARVWDARTGQAITPPLRHRSAVYYAAFSPNGKRVVTRCRDDSARVWDADTGRPVTPPLMHEHLRDVTFSPDGNLVVTSGGYDGGKQGAALVWEVESGKQVVSPLLHTDVVNHAAFSPDGRRLASAGNDHSVRIWDLQTEKRLAVLNDEGPFVRSVFSPDGRLVLTASVHKARLWDAVTFEPLWTFNHDRITHAEFSPDGTRVLTTSRDKTVRVWDVETGGQVGVSRHEHPVGHASFNPLGRALVVGDSGGSVHFWDVAGNRYSKHTLNHCGPVTSVSWSSDLWLVLTASTDGTARLWDLMIDHGDPRFGPRGKLHTASFSPDGRRVITAMGNGTAQIWDATTSQPIGAPLQHAGPVTCAVFSSDARRVATASRDGTARVWNAENGAAIATLEHLAKPVVLPSAQFYDENVDVAFSPDGQLVATAGFDERAQVWEAATGKLVWSFEHNGVVNRARFSPDGRYLVTASYDSTALLWDVRTGDVVSEFRHNRGAVVDVRFSPDGRRIATASFDGSACVWNAQSGEPTTPPLRHKQRVNQVMFSPDGRLVATASDDQTVRVWNSETGEQVLPLLVHGYAANWTSFSADGRLLATGGVGAPLRLWDVSTGEPLAPQLDSAQHAEFRPNSRWLLSVRRLEIAEMREVQPDPRRISDLALLAEVLSGRRIDSVRALSQLEPDAFRTAWQGERMRELIEIESARQIALHGSSARWLVRWGNWVPAILQLHRLAAARPDDWTEYLKSSEAWIELGPWDEKSAAFVRKWPAAGPVMAALLNDLAWTLAMHPNAHSRNSGLAVQFARQAVELDPQTRYRTTLGFAHWRAGDAEAALNAVEGIERHGLSDFLLAMGSWQLGRREAARQCYDRAVSWIEQHGPDDELRRIRAEADALMGVKIQPSGRAELNAEIRSPEAEVNQ